MGKRKWCVEQEQLGDVKMTIIEHKEAIKVIAALERIAQEADADPNVWKTEEEYYRKYGTLTEEDIRKTFSI